MLWGDWNVCTFETLCLSLAKKVFFENLPSMVFTPLGSPVPGGQKPSLPLRKVPPLISVFSPQGRRGKPPYSVLYLPHLSLPCGRVLNPLPSPRPFQNGKGCNRTFSVLGTATLYGWRTIKGLRQVVRAGTA